MLCEKCKIREANIILTEVVNGIKTEHNLCSQCASQTQLKTIFRWGLSVCKNVVWNSWTSIRSNR